MNSSLLNLKLDQDQMWEDLQRFVSPPPVNPLALWEAITRLDNKVVNNTVKVGADQTFGSSVQRSSMFCRAHFTFSNRE